MKRAGMTSVSRFGHASAVHALSLSGDGHSLFNSTVVVAAATRAAFFLRVS
jgi:hypothetical protein